MPSNITDYYTEEVGKRVELCEKIIASYMARATENKLLREDLDRIVSHGKAAKEADRLQREQLTEAAIGRTAKSGAASTVFARETELHEVLPAVIGTLKRAGDTAAAEFLANLSFARYRVKTLAVPVVPGAASAEAEEIKKVERVARGDIASRADGLDAFVAAVLRRASIATALAARGVTEAWLTALAADARATSAGGSNRPQSAAATETESVESRRHREAWSESKRLIRRVVRGVPELSAMFAEC